MTYRLTRQAKSDIKAIYRYTVEYFGEGQAQEYLDGLEYSFDLLADNPNMGRLFDEKIRRYIYKSHLVYLEETPPPKILKGIHKFFLNKTSSARARFPAHTSCLMLVEVNSCYTATKYLRFVVSTVVSNS